VIGPTFSHSLYVGMMIQTFGLADGIDFLDAAGSRPRIPRLSPPLLALQPNRGQRLESGHNEMPRGTASIVSASPRVLVALTSAGKGSEDSSH
jgi:hypothetical protein